MLLHRSSGNGSGRATNQLQPAMATPAGLPPMSVAMNAAQQGNGNEDTSSDAFRMYSYKVSGGGSWRKRSGSAVPVPPRWPRPRPCPRHCLHARALRRWPHGRGRLGALLRRRAPATAARRFSLPLRPRPCALGRGFVGAPTRLHAPLLARPLRACTQVRPCKRIRPHDWSSCPYAHPGARGWLAAPGAGAPRPAGPTRRARSRARWWSCCTSALLTAPPAAAAPLLLLFPAGEKATRRCPLTYPYSAVACLDFKRVRACTRASNAGWLACSRGVRQHCLLLQPPPGACWHKPLPCFRLQAGACHRGDACPFAHGIFEWWLHPTRYRTQVGVRGALVHGWRPCLPAVNALACPASLRAIKPCPCPAQPPSLVPWHPEK